MLGGDVLNVVPLDMCNAIARIEEGRAENTTKAARDAKLAEINRFTVAAAVVAVVALALAESLPWTRGLKIWTDCPNWHHILHNWNTACWFHWDTLQPCRLCFRTCIRLEDC